MSRPALEVADILRAQGDRLPGMMDLQVDLKLDYKANLERYPLYQRYLSRHHPPFARHMGKK